MLVAVLLAWWIVDWVVRGRPFGSRKGLRGLLAFAVPVAVAGVLLVGYNLVRFGSPFDTGYHFDSGEGLHHADLAGVVGPVVQPVSQHLPAHPAVYCQHARFCTLLAAPPQRGSAIAAVSLALILMYSAWWMWWGGYAWGPRFLVPLTPFWVLLLAPVVEKLETGAWRLRRSGADPGADPAVPRTSLGGVVLFWVTAVLPLSRRSCRRAPYS